MKTKPYSDRQTNLLKLRTEYDRTKDDDKASLKWLGFLAWGVFCFAFGYWAGTTF